MAIPFSKENNTICVKDLQRLKCKPAEEALIESEERFRTAFEDASTGIALMANDGYFLKVNQTLCRLLGYSEEELMGKTWVEITEPDDLDGCFDWLKRVKAGEKSSYEKRFIHKLGYPLWVTVSSSVIRDAQDQIRYYISLFHDISRRKKVEEALREKTHDFRERLKELNCLYSISGLVENIDTSTDEVLQAVANIIPPSLQYPEVTCARILLNGKEYRTENFKQTKCEQSSGIFVYGEQKGILEICYLDEQLETDKRPFLKEERDLINAIAERLGHTVERKQTEEALRESEEKYRRLMQTTSEGCWLINPERKTIEVNQSLCKILGYRQDEMIGKTPFDFVDDKNRKIFIEQTSKIPDTTHRSYEITLKKKNGQDLHTYFNATTLKDKSGAVQGAFAFVTDITQRKRAEEERDRLSVAIEQASESVFITDKNGTIQYVNPAFERVTGYSRKDAIGQNPRMLKSGKQDALFYKQMWDTLARGHVWKGRFINRKKDGSLYEADATISPILDKSGNITHFVSMKRDVTREIELERNLIQAQKMESIGTLAGGIAHDFNNILGIIIANAELAVNDVPDTSPAKEYLDEIRSASLRASALVKQILCFARKSLAERNPIQISPIIKNSLGLLRASIPATIEISQDLSCGFDTVLADPTQISQVVMNLCTNAAQAMGEYGGVLKVTLKNVELKKQDEALDVEPGRYVKLTVRDTGHGIEPEIANRIFDPYFTTKEVGKGTGMGLSVVHGIVRSYDGMITVTSEPGKGSVFEVLFPVIEAETKQKVKEPEALPTGNERILFVDDEQSLVKVVRRILEQLGYEVETKINPVEALELFRSGPDRFDLVITDMSMPQMTGKRLVKEILNIRADMPIVLCTGYHEKISEEKARGLGIKDYVTKPFVMQNFALTVRKVLDECLSLSSKRTRKYAKAGLRSE
jgi:PAS domain S-box-containing protein